MRILIVDDARAIRTRLRSMLVEVAGITEVHEAGDGDEALTLLRRLRPDIVVLDLHLPIRNGFGVLAALAEEPSAPRCVVVTNDATEHHRREALRLGADHFFDKSTEFEDVIALIADLAGASDSAPREV